MFLWTAEEHLPQIGQSNTMHNLKLKPSKCRLFKEEINYLARRVSKQGVWPSDANLKATAECALP